MIFLRSSILLISLIVLSGCASAKPEKVYVPKSEIVKVPTYVVYKLERPSRPEFTAEDTLPTYLVKLTTYAEKLEVIIDEHNQKQGAGHVLP